MYTHTAHVRAFASGWQLFSSRSPASHAEPLGFPTCPRQARYSQCVIMVGKARQRQSGETHSHQFRWARRSMLCKGAFKPCQPTSRNTFMLQVRVKKRLRSVGSCWTLFRGSSFTPQMPRNVSGCLRVPCPHVGLFF